MMPSKLGYPPSLTNHLLDSDPDAFRAATQSKFLSLAASGELDSAKLGLWLTYDRIYIHKYLIGTGRLLEIASREIPREVGLWKNHPTTRLIDWLTDSMVNIRREERFFIETAEKYGISLDTEDYHETVPAVADFEKIFLGIKAGQRDCLGWLEGAVVFWATEKCYLEAWTWAKRHVEEKEAAGLADQRDAGAMRAEFIPNWTSPEFVAFVDALGSLIDDAVAKALEGMPDREASIISRSLAKWNEVLAAETRFWPNIE
ncbi:hypothetical protein MKZ38_002875 [Zalerion maritima]|uniref:Thiaminase-2/PQQC domain-containing protein n=1 Tax=Zalerion maritima TaxID=339359 RepID=A0AAD5WWR2_9PEZI|nr:hypothetical protein MKZ38_002875 [Zalerion maritima]